MTYTHKIGATLELAGHLTLDGAAQDMSGWSAAAQMRGPAGLVDLAVVWLNAGVGQLLLGAAASDQASWQPGRYAVDVRLTSPDGVVLISDSAQVVLVEAVTQGAP